MIAPDATDPLIGHERRALARSSAWRAAYGTTHKLVVHLEDGRREVYELEDAFDQRPIDPGALPEPLERELAGYVALETDEAGNYEQARDWAKRTTEVTPDFMAGWRYLAASLAYLGQLDEARAAKDQLLRVMPNDSLSYLRKSFPSASPERVEQLVEGLRKAGLPE